MRGRRLTVSDLADAARCGSQAVFDKSFGAAPVRRWAPRRARRDKGARSL